MVSTLRHTSHPDTIKYSCVIIYTMLLLLRSLKDNCKKIGRRSPSGSRDEIALVLSVSGSLYDTVQKEAGRSNHGNLSAKGRKI